MRNGSTAVVERPTTPSSVDAQTTANPPGDFLATYVKGPAKYTGTTSIATLDRITTAPLADMTDRMFVMVTGTVADVRIFDASKPLSVKAVIVIDSGTGAALTLSVTRRRYDLDGRHLTAGRLVRVSGNLHRQTPDAPAVLRLDRVTPLGEGS